LYLVGGIPAPLKNMLVSWDHYSQNIENQIHVTNHQPGISLKKTIRRCLEGNIKGDWLDWWSYPHLIF
jgi:hypothetical protein